MRNHPGGKEVIYNAVKESSDITEAFNKVGHSTSGIYSNIIYSNNLTHLLNLTNYLSNYT